MSDINNKLIIVGAGGDSRQIVEFVERNVYYNILGYLDDDFQKQGKFIDGCEVIGKISDSYKYSTSSFVVIIGNACNYSIKSQIVKKLHTNNFAMLKHPESCVSAHAKIGVGTVITYGVCIEPGACIGDHVLILSNSCVAHDVVIGDYSIITNSASIAGGVHIGKRCYVGANASIKDGITVGEGSLVGIGSVVIRNVPPFSKVVGNPARIVGD